MIKPPYHLRCEYLENPIEIDTPLPRFSWVLEHEQRNQSQSAYQIIVSSEKILSNSDEGDLWDTGKVSSENNVNIEYNGRVLQSSSMYYWRVKWWDKSDSESNFSEASSFGTALLEESDWKAKWISKKEFINLDSRRELQYRSQERDFMGRLLDRDFNEVHAIYLRKEFTLEKIIKTAEIYICGLGYHELRINGKRIGDRVLEPAQTDYNKIALYSTYDITSYLENNNAIGVILGNGRCVEHYGYDYPKLIVQIHLHYNDGTSSVIISDNSWKLSNGPIMENGIYHGEKYDARLEIPGWDKPNFEDKEWENATVVKGHKLASQLMQPIKITKILKPQQLKSPQAGMYVFDFGQNFTGFVRIKVQGPKGCKIKLRFAEILDEVGMLNTATNGNAPATDIYILKGEGEEIYTPHFTYHGFRYVELTGFPGVPTIETIEGLFFHSDVPKIGDFFCSNDLLNKIHSNIIWGQLSNLMSIPTDCPQRDERHGWMGDAQLVTEEAMMNFDMAQFYTNYLRNIQVCQMNDGSLSDVVPPYWPIYPADPAWGTAYITIAWYMYWYYNDIKILKEYYESMKLYVDFLSNSAEENISLLGRYGDWCPPSSIASKRTPVELVSTWYYYHDTFLFSKIAKILGFEEDFDYYSKKAEEIKNDFNKNFLIRTYKYIKVSPVDRAISQTSNALPLYLNMVPEDKEKEVLLYLIEAIKGHYDYHNDAGIVGTRYIFEVLTNNGYPEIAYKMIKQTSFPGYGYMIKEGATTLWERWEKLESSGMNSHNHIMLGSVDTWFYKTLAGIKSLEPCWNTLQIKPYIPNDMDYATASIETIKGRIYSAWEKIGNKLVITLEIPVGINAESWIPIKDIKSEIREGDTLIWKDGEKTPQHGDIEFKELKENSVVLSLGSGYYKFSIKNS
ncbi:MAG: family 78 glycoside hydrolase catalytic domain [Candidatus Lokiarchaeota archaeon]|nr:family 78 glycoside hydrolase catalytic domain [Candidatus Lokiarchaeota archaeon]